MYRIFILSWVASLALVAHAGSYQPADLLAGYRRGLPDATLRSMASQTREASAVEKACLLHGGVPAGLVDRVKGPAPAPWAEVLAPECARLGVSVATLQAEEAAANAAAKADFEEREAARERVRLAHERPACFVPEAERLMDKPDQLAASVQAWMGDQLAQGREQFITLNWGTSTTVQGSGVGTTIPIVCAW